MSRHRIYDSITRTTFDTPLVRLSKVIPEDHATVLLKLEFFNPYASVKDRIGWALIEGGEHTGNVNRETHIIEPTSGNTGIALAFVAAARGYRLTLVMPESMSVERRAMLRALGANIELTSADAGMQGSIERAQEMADRIPNSWIPQQFDNPVNPGVHETTTGPEIWDDTGGRVDLFVAGVGTGGTLTGVARFLRHRNPQIQAIAVEPAESPVLSRWQAGGAPDSGNWGGVCAQESRPPGSKRRGDGRQRRGLCLGSPAGTRRRDSGRHQHRSERGGGGETGGSARESRQR